MIINSLLDTDWYKLTMAQVAYFNSFGTTLAKYKFYNRGNTKFPIGGIK
jgi:nicotinic acid phosphoribosyltransferase